MKDIIITIILIYFNFSICTCSSSCHSPVWDKTSSNYCAHLTKPFDASVNQASAVMCVGLCSFTSMVIITFDPKLASLILKIFLMILSDFVN